MNLAMDGYGYICGKGDHRKRIKGDTFVEQWKLLEPLDHAFVLDCSFFAFLKLYFLHLLKT